MKQRNRLFAVTALLGAMLLAACGDEPGNPTPAPTAAPTAPATSEAQPSATSPEAASSPTSPEAGAPTATASEAASDEPLQLSPVVVETTDATRTGALAQERTLNAPPGFHVEVYAANLPGVRWLAHGPDGAVFATLRQAGRVVTMRDGDGDGTADEVKTFAEGMPGVHGIVLKENGVYVATETDIIRLEDTNGDGAADKRDVLAQDLPAGGGHSTRTLAWGADGKLYVAAGSSCNVCVEDDPKRAAISRYSAEGQFEKVLAEGLRNAVGLVTHPETGELWATNNGRDNIGDDIPPEAIYNVKEGTHYGWPYCYGNQMPDPEVRPQDASFCERTGVPAVEMQAHSAPLGLAFYTGDLFPEEFRGDLFVGFHGSWNRTVPTGYKVVRIRFSGNQPDKSNPDLLVEDFITGWHLGQDAWGRPVNPMVGPDGSLLLTDDKAGVIYRVYYQENSGP